jgi:hypothetical protein
MSDRALTVGGGRGDQAGDEGIRDDPRLRRNCEQAGSGLGDDPRRADDPSENWWYAPAKVRK